MGIKLRDFLCIELPVSKTTITVDGYTIDVLSMAFLL